MGGFAGKGLAGKEVTEEVTGCWRSKSFTPQVSARQPFTFSHDRAWKSKGQKAHGKCWDNVSVVQCQIAVLGKVHR
jgi:hypothetical protein